MARKDRGFADQNAGDESAEDCVHANQVGYERHHAHNQKNCSDDGEVADEDVVDPTNDNENKPASHGQAQSHERERAKDALRQTPGVDMALQRQAENDGGDHPADGVINDCGGQDHLTDRAAEKVHFADHRCHDLDRCDRKRGAKQE